MNDGATNGDNEALPWLEPVDDEDQPRGVSARKMLAALLMVGIAVAIIAGTTFYLGRQSGGSGPPELIRAEAGPYRCGPTIPAGSMSRGIAAPLLPPARAKTMMRSSMSAS